MSENDSSKILKEGFYILKIDDKIFARIKGKSYKDNCTIPIEELRYLHILHKDLKGETKEGEIICNVYIAEILIDIFKKLYLENYPIEKFRLVDEYDADDESSMRDNNSSCFNFRFISFSKKISKHGLGLAIDINSLYNPYIKIVNGKMNIEPANAEEYVDRKKNFKYKIEENDLCCKFFKEHGFIWGGDWDDPKDYQHFEIPDEVVKKIYPIIYN